MTATIAKPINTANRRLKEGDPVSIFDDLAPHTFEGLRESGFIKVAPSKATETEPRSGRPAKT